MLVKICGITKLEDALIAADLGADILGFIFAKGSPRAISAYEAGEIIGKLLPAITPVGVFVNSPLEEVQAVIEQSGIKCVQLHGKESPYYCQNINVPVIKAFRVNKDFCEEILSEYSVEAYLLDTYVNGTAGGTGKTFDWNIAVKAKSYGRIILAGGLTPENVADAITRVGPYGIDISSGVESAPGKKDREKLKRLFGAIDTMRQTGTIEQLGELG